MPKTNTVLPISSRNGLQARHWPPIATVNKIPNSIPVQIMMGENKHKEN